MANGTVTAEVQAESPSAEVEKAKAAPLRDASLLDTARNALQFTAVLAAVVYGCGFIVVTFSQARFGIVEFTTLRPKVISAGLSFLFFVSMPMVLAFQWFDMFGFRRGLTLVFISPKPWDTPTNRHKKMAEVMSAVSYSIGALLVAGSFVTFFFREEHGTGGLLGLLTGIAILIYLASSPALKRMFESFPVRVMLIRLVLAVAAFASFWFSFRDRFWLSVWFLIVPGLFYAHRPSISDWRAMAFDNFVPLAAGVLLLYSSQIYPHLKPQYGGGLSPGIVIFLSEKGPLGSPNTRIDARLVDETEQGYYLQPANAETAYFVPRSSVAAIQFVPETEWR